jgi:hypothetical protein
MSKKTTEHERLADTQADWKRWGPYLSERAWGTVREDYSASGDPWQHFPHDHARSRAYRWNEDGLAGVSDSSQYLCMAVALWNEQDIFLKERLFGVSRDEGNHGEDVKEYYFYLDNTPTHSYMKMLYKYPQVAFPYSMLVEENQQRGYESLEFELIDALKNVFEEQRYFDVVIEYAKVNAEDIMCRISVTNRGPDAAPIHILPHLWYRNTWSWDYNAARPEIQAIQAPKGMVAATTTHEKLGERWWYGRAKGSEKPLLLFTENETNIERLYGHPNVQPCLKDSINDAVVGWEYYRLKPDKRGSKVAAHFKAVVKPGETFRVETRLSNTVLKSPFANIGTIFQKRQQEADEFYQAIQRPDMSDDERLVQRQALAGMLWSKQFYHFDVDRWLRGDPSQPLPPPERRTGRNHHWVHFNASDILSVPDKWEYPGFASWDLAFHCVPLAMVDPDFAKAQLVTLGYEWYQHPSGQIPAYEWDFSDVNPPVLAWAAWKVYQLEQRFWGRQDTAFLERVFHKLMLSFTWWVNRKDIEGHNIFQGGFLGLDNIGVFDRSKPLPTGGRIEQSDSTSWMGMFCLNMLTIAIELAGQNPVYEDIATRFFEHFLYIAHAMNNIGEAGFSLWDDKDEFFYDVLHCEKQKAFPIKVRSLVGVIPLFAVATLDPAKIDKLPVFKQRLEWFLKNRPHLARLVSRWYEPGSGETRLMAIARGHRMKRVLRRMLDPEEFLSDYGVRSLSRYHLAHPYVFHIGHNQYTVSYQPAESDSGMFGGNSNWRGPIWMPINYLIVESLREFHRYYGDDFKVECPTGSGQLLTLNEIADHIAARLMRLFLRDGDNRNRRAVFGGTEYFQTDPNWHDYIPFSEYFHGDIGAGIGASHQTGWTGLIASLLQDCPSGIQARQPDPAETEAPLAPPPPEAEAEAAPATAPPVDDELSAAGEPSASGEPPAISAPPIEGEPSAAGEPPVVEEATTSGEPSAAGELPVVGEPPAAETSAAVGEPVAATEESIPDQPAEDKDKPTPAKKSSSTAKKPSSTAKKPSSTTKKSSSTAKKPSSTTKKSSSTAKKPSSTAKKPSSTTKKSSNKQAKPPDQATESISGE